MMIKIPLPTESWKEDGRRRQGRDVRRLDAAGERSGAGGSLGLRGEAGGAAGVGGDRIYIYLEKIFWFLLNFFGSLHFFYFNISYRCIENKAFSKSNTS